MNEFTVKETVKKLNSDERFGRILWGGLCGIVCAALTLGSIRIFKEGVTGKVYDVDIITDKE